jgi:predicted kinase
MERHKTKEIVWGECEMSRLIVFAGPPCSGKSTLAEIISKKMSAKHLSVDDISLEINPRSDYSEEDRNKNYEEMHRRAKKLMESGSKTVVLDATYARGIQRLALEHLAKDLDADIKLIECWISPEVAGKRWEERKHHPATDMSKDRAQKLAKNYRYTSKGYSVITDQHPSRYARGILKYLGEGK